jgi:hypothetical protein
MPRNLAINIILNTMQTLRNVDQLMVNVMQGQRNIRLVIMTAIDIVDLENNTETHGQYVSGTEPFI